MTEQTQPDHTEHLVSLVAKLYPFNYSITGIGNDNAIEQYLSELDFTIHEYASGQSLNGWHIPHAWTVKTATIAKDNKVIYDATDSPLGVGTLSPSFRGKLSLPELKSHLNFDTKLPDAVLYQWQNLYRPNESKWSISMPARQVAELTEGDYRVELATELTPNSMKVLDYFLPGESEDTIIINGHNCHPFQANDDISGCAVAIRVMQQLKKMSKRRYSYRIIIAPELHGPMFWLDQASSTELAKLKGCILLKSVGNPAAIRLQHSYLGTDILDKAAVHAFTSRYGDDFEQGDFRAIYGNDETVFEAPPYNIPCISLTRWPFVEYHTDLDTPECLSEHHLQDSMDLVLTILEQLEYQQKYQRQFQGLICLSAYGLYKSIPEVGESGVDYGSLHGRWNRLMNCLPREIDNDLSVFELAEKFRLPANEVYDYLEKWVEQGLLTRKY